MEDGTINLDQYQNDSSHVVARLRDGGVAELSRQFIQMRPNLRAMLARRIHGKLLSRLDSSDIVQETFIRASRMLSSYLKNPRIHPAIWLRMLSKQILAEMVRDQFRLKRSPDCEEHVIENDAMVDFLADSMQSVGREMERAELVGIVRRMLARISTTDCELLEMRHAEQFSFQEIGDVLEISMEAAKKRYYRALDRFRAVALEEPTINMEA